jgi:hypothetical protein
MPKFSELTEVVFLDGDEYLAIVQDGNSRKHKLRNRAFGIQELDSPVSQFPQITTTTTTIIMGDLTGGYSGALATGTSMGINNDPLYTGTFENLICVGDISDTGKPVTTLMSNFTPLANNIFSAAGNHDYDAGITGLQAFQDNAEFDDTYFKVSLGEVDLFFIDSNTHTDNNIASAAAYRASTMGTWVANELAESTAAWKGVVFHHPSYSSESSHGSSTYMRLDWAELGAHFILNGHAHTYERLHVDGVVQIIVGTAGGVPRGFGSILPESRQRFGSTTSTSGAGYVRLKADHNNLILEFLSTGNVIRDQVRLYKKS